MVSWFPPRKDGNRLLSRTEGCCNNLQFDRACSPANILKMNSSTRVLRIYGTKFHKFTFITKKFLVPERIWRTVILIL